ncbi:hypothetical protein [Streptomyces canus]|uniref:hypothetical protein n=1 Tax=Streptomyces canus TaxID=58343 RepID=UPI00131A037A|nr:hypothetical protein [Streptomyces canus]
MKPSDQHTPKHDPRNCGLCGTLRHPAQAKAGRALTKHLAANPFPKQGANA